MAGSRSQAEYDRRLRAVIEYIDRHLSDNLDLATPAAVRLRFQHDVPVSSIALNIGFGTVSAVRQPASRIRNGARPAGRMAAPENKETAMPVREVRLLERDPVTVAYLQHIGPYGPLIGRF